MVIRIKSAITIQKWQSQTSQEQENSLLAHRHFVTVL